MRNRIERHRWRRRLEIRPPHSRCRRWHRYAVVSVMPGGDRWHWGYFFTRRGAMAWSEAGEHVYPGARFYRARLDGRG